MGVLMPEAAIRKLLVDDSDVAAIVGSNMFPQYAPQSADFDYIVYNRISSDHQHHFTAASGLVEVTVQIDGYTREYITIKDLGDKMRLTLDGYYGIVTDSGDTISIDVIRLINHRDGFERPQGATDKAYHRIIQDYSMWCQEVVPAF